MRKLYLLTLAALLVMSGVAFAAGIPNTVDAKNLPSVWIETVYNNSGSDLTSGTVVVWDFGSSTGDYADQCNWVTTTTTASDPWTAGVVVSNTLETAGVGAIAIKGVVNVTTQAALTADDLVGTTTTAGMIAEVTAPANDQAFLGVCVNAVVNAETMTKNAIIYVDPTINFDD